VNSVKYRLKQRSKKRIHQHVPVNRPKIKQFERTIQDSRMKLKVWKGARARMQKYTSFSGPTSLMGHVTGVYISRLSVWNVKYCQLPVFERSSINPCVLCNLNVWRFRGQASLYIRRYLSPRKSPTRESSSGHQIYGFTTTKKAMADWIQFTWQGWTENGLHDWYMPSLPYPTYCRVACAPNCKPSPRKEHRWP